MGLILLCFNWILFFIELGKNVKEMISAIMLYFYSFVVTPQLDCVKDKVVVVTGASRGLGKEITLQLAKLGAQVIMLDADEHTNTCSANEIRRMGGLKVFAFACDVSKGDEVRSIAEKVLKFFGKVDILINNSFSWDALRSSSLLEMSLESIEQTLNMGLLSCFWMARAFLPSMIERKAGQIVAVSSLTGILSAQKFSSYRASQHGVLGAMSALNSELEEYPGINLSTICPIIDVNRKNFTKEEGILARYFRPMDTEQTAHKVLEAIRTRIEFVTVPKGFTSILLLERIIPTKMMKYIQNFIIGTDSSENVNRHQTIITTNGNSCH